MSASDESPQAGVTQQVLDRYRGTVSGPVSPSRWLMTRTMTHVSTAVTTSAVTMCHQCQCQSQCQCAPTWDLMLIMSAWCSAAHAQSLTISGVQIWTVAGESEVITAWPRLSSSPSPGHSGHLGPVQLARRHTECLLSDRLETHNMDTCNVWTLEATTNLREVPQCLEKDPKRQGPHLFVERIKNL